MSMIKGLNIIRKWVMSKMMKKSDDGIMVTLPDSKKVDLNTNITADRLLRNGVDIEQLTNPNQVDNLINQINKSEMRVISQDDPRFKGIMDKIMGKKGEVFDMEGKKIKPGSKIMGGKAVDEDLPPPGSRGGPDDIAAPVQSAEEATTNLTDSTIQKIKKMEPIDAMKEANKVIKREGIYQALDKKQAKKILDDTEDHIFERDVDPEDFASGGRVGLKSGSYLFQGLKGLGKRYKGSSLQSLLENPKVMGTEIGYEGLAEILRLIGLKEGGRADFAKGGMTRRAFLKLLGAAGAGVGAAKTGILKLIGSDAGKKAMEEKIVETSTQAPPYFFKLVDKIKKFGEDTTRQLKGSEREQVTSYRTSDADYDLYEDLNTGSQQIKIRKGDPDGSGGYKEQELTLTKGLSDESSGKVPDEYDEYTVRPDSDGKLKDIDEGLEDIDDLIDELGPENISVKELQDMGYDVDRLGPLTKRKLGIKKASGGIARMLGE